MTLLLTLPQCDTDNASVLPFSHYGVCNVHVCLGFVYCEILFYSFNMLKNILLSLLTEGDLISELDG